MRPPYQTQATAVGGRDGRATSVDGALRVRLGEDGTNPEQLFAAAYAACFLNNIRRVAARSGIAITDDSNVTATVGLIPDDGGSRLTVTLAIDLPGLTAEQARDVAERAHMACPYSGAVRGNVEVRLSLE
ncbi:MAG: organic hydroperoxide resistance protein [Rhizorhabdus sp.]|nr:organic hydroperoxide resistance protein [Rhizorhabdus sp.]